MNNINLNLYNIFSYVANSKSFADAARKLKMSTSNVNVHMSNLEKKLDSKLFNRSHNGISLTNAGKELYSFVSKGMFNIESGEELLKRKNILSTGTVRIACPSHITLYYLTDCIKNAKREFPRLNIELVGNGSANELLNQLKSDKVDFVLLDNIHTADDSLVVKNWKSVKNIFVSKTPLKISNIKELEDLEYILNFEYSNTHKKLLDVFKKCGIEIKYISKSDITEVRVDLAKKGVGIAYVMKKSVEKELECHELYEVELPITLPSIDISLIYTKDTLKKIDKSFINKYL